MSYLQVGLKILVCLDANVTRTFSLFITIIKQHTSFVINYLVGFFLPATVLTLPLRVRALVLVRCPRKGKPLRWRKPR